ncbi:MAG: hypothetical protein JXB32_13575 [Deltaproteobacteria bacterium]|nr:hypothetical protein [Deltaproteobacteria bacterium]
MPRRRIASRRRTLALAGVALLGCYQSWSDEGDGGLDARPDRADDATVEDARPDRTEDAGLEDSVADDAGPEAEVFPECPPEPGDGTWLSFSVDDDPYAAVDLALDCEVSAVTAISADTSAVVLQCDDPSGYPLHRITIRANPHPPLASLEGRRVHFRHVAETWFEWTERHVLLRQTDASGTLLLAGIDSENLSPREIAASDWYHPYSVELAGDVCPVRPDPCGTRERQALDVSFGSDAGRFFDGYQGTLGTHGRLWVHVGVASRYHEMTCVDLPRAYYQALLVLLEDG